MSGAQDVQAWPPRGRLTPDLAARAVVSAAALLGFDPAQVFVEVRDGRGRVRQLAAAALVQRDDRPVKACARIMKVHPNTLSPTGLVKRRIFSEQVAHVQAEIFAIALTASGPDLAEAAERKRGEAGWVDPKRDMVREARVLKAFADGDGPYVIARREGMSPTSIYKMLKRNGVDPSSRPAAKAAAKPPAKAKSEPRTRRAPAGRKAAAPVKAQAKPRPVQAAPKPVRGAPPPCPPSPPPAVEPFPDDHQAWAPLPGVEPSRLVDHRNGCRWPVTVVGRSEPMVCNGSVQAGTPYCARHHWLSLAPSVRVTAAARPAPSPPPVRMARPAAVGRDFD